MSLSEVSSGLESGYAILKGIKQKKCYILLIPGGPRCWFIAILDMEYYSAMRNALATIWMVLKGNMLSEISQTKMTAA